jgi:hypothetical protein
LALTTGTWEGAGSAVGYACIGLGGLVDAPLSLAGDIVTLPVVVARRQGCRWATWWGEQAVPEAIEKPPESPDPPRPQAPAELMDEES